MARISLLSSLVLFIALGFAVNALAHDPLLDILHEKPKAAAANWAAAPKVAVKPKETAAPRLVVKPKETAAPRLEVKPKETAAPRLEVKSKETAAPRLEVKSKETAAPRLEVKSKETAASRLAVKDLHKGKAAEKPKDKEFYARYLKRAGKLIQETAAKGVSEDLIKKAFKLRDDVLKKAPKAAEPAAMELIKELEVAKNSKPEDTEKNVNKARKKFVKKASAEEKKELDVMETAISIFFEKLDKNVFQKAMEAVNNYTPKYPQPPQAAPKFSYRKFLA